MRLVRFVAVDTRNLGLVWADQKLWEELQGPVRLTVNMFPMPLWHELMVVGDRGSGIQCEEWIDEGGF